MDNADGNALDYIPPTIVEKLKGSEETSGAHIASQYNDTSAGAVHAFQGMHYLVPVHLLHAKKEQFSLENSLSQINAL